jgi:molecular chaperone HtpG
MKPDQKAIYYLAGADRAALAASPHVEARKRRGFEVLLFVDPIDEFFVQRMREFEKKPLAAIDRGDLELDSKAEQEARENLERENRDLLTALEESLAAYVKSVRFTTRLSGSAAVLVNDAHGLSPHMERVLRAAHQDVKSSKRVLELDPDHPVVQKLIALHRETPRSPMLAEAAELVYGQALLAEGSPVPDGARFAKLVAKWMLGPNG